MIGRVAAGLCGAALFSLLPAGDIFPKTPPEADSAQVWDEDNPHPRRYYVIYREILQGGLRTDDVGVYDPYKETPRYEPRIPY